MAIYDGLDPDEISPGNNAVPLGKVAPTPNQVPEQALGDTPQLHGWERAEAIGKDAWQHSWTSEVTNWLFAKSVGYQFGPEAEKELKEQDKKNVADADHARSLAANSTLTDKLLNKGGDFLASVMDPLALAGGEGVGGLTRMAIAGKAATLGAKAANSAAKIALEAGALTAAGEGITHLTKDETGQDWSVDNFLSSLEQTGGILTGAHTLGLLMRNKMVANDEAQSTDRATEGTVSSTSVDATNTDPNIVSASKAQEMVETVGTDLEAGNRADLNAVIGAILNHFQKGPPPTAEGLKLKLKPILAQIEAQKSKGAEVINDFVDFVNKAEPAEKDIEPIASYLGDEAKQVKFAGESFADPEYVPTGKELDKAIESVPPEALKEWADSNGIDKSFAKFVDDATLHGERMKALSSWLGDEIQNHENMSIIHAQPNIDTGALLNQKINHITDNTNRLYQGDEKVNEEAIAKEHPYETVNRTEKEVKEALSDVPHGTIVQEILDSYDEGEERSQGDDDFIDAVAKCAMESEND